MECIESTSVNDYVSLHHVLQLFTFNNKVCRHHGLVIGLNPCENKSQKTLFISLHVYNVSLNDRNHNIDNFWFKA